jgi:hypothetical protein
MEDTVLSDAQGHTSYMLEHDQANSTFCANGRTRTANANGPARIVFNAGGSITPRLMDTGACTTAPGQGVVHGDAGLVIETIRVSGPPIVEPPACPLRASRASAPHWRRSAGRAHGGGAGSPVGVTAAGPAHPRGGAGSQAGGRGPIRGGCGDPGRESY